MTTTYVAAVDLGASSGLITLAAYEKNKNALTLSEMHRFPNQFIKCEGHDCWDINQLIQEINLGLEKTLTHLEGSSLASIAIDTWGVDFVLLDKKYQRLGEAIAYRDNRTNGIMEDICQTLGKEIIYNKTGIQFLTFNTLYQLKALARNKPKYFDDIAHFVMIPDYLSFALTGSLNTEYTNTTTTQLLNVHTNTWDQDLLKAIEVPIKWFHKPVMPGNKIGTWQASNGIKTPVHACASHDTASAVLATPIHADKNSAYLSSGTWSLMGIESNKPIANRTSLELNFTNEGGYDQQFRILKNIMGLWLLQCYCKEHDITDICKLVEEAKTVSPFKTLINPNDARFLNPQSITQAINDFCQQYHEVEPKTHSEYARAIFDSLALMYRHTLKELELIKHQPIEQINIVGGGSQNTLLNQLCADVCNIPVIAGPIEASCLGNIGSQLISLNALDDRTALRTLIQNNFELIRYTPNAITSIDQLYSRFTALLN